MTLNIVESAIKFREQIKAGHYLAGDEEKSEAASYFPILYKGTDYLLQMKTDCNFLASTEIGKIYNLSVKNDPFLLGASVPHVSCKGNSKYIYYLKHIY